MAPTFVKVELSLLQKKYDSLQKASEKNSSTKSAKEFIKKWIDQYPMKEDVIPLVLEIPIEYTNDMEKLKQFMILKSKGILEIFQKRKNNNVDVETG